MSKCRYIEICPAATGWCNNIEPSTDCIGRVARIYQALKNQKSVLILKEKYFLRQDEDREKNRLKFVEQLKSGVVIVPSTYDVEYKSPEVIIKRGECDGSV